MATRRQQKRVIGVSFEPWDTEVLAGTLSEFQGEGCEVHLCIGDTWQVERVRAARKFDEICTNFDVSATRILDSINEWRVGALLFAARNIWKRNELQPPGNLSREELERLFATDHVFSCEERRPYYLPMASSAKLYVFEKVVARCQQTLAEFEPTDIVMIGDNYLVKNVFASLAANIGIPVHVIRATRVSNFGVVQPFWPDQEWASEFLHRPSSPLSIPDQALRERLPYAPQSGRHLATLAAYRGRGMRFLFSRLPTFVRQRLSERIAHRKFVRYPLVAGLTWVYTSSRALTAMYGLLRILRSSLFLAGWTRLESAHIQEPFVLVPLHTRPESSSLTQGRGFRDEDVLEQLVRQIRKQENRLQVYALENPSSIGDNRKGLYDLCSDLGVTVLSPIADTPDLIRRAEAVVSLSGTALLEAEQVGVPAFAVGHPEFRPFLASDKMSLDQFLARVTADAEWDFSASRAYQDELARRGSTLELGWAAVRDERSLRSSVELVAQLLRGDPNFGARPGFGALGKAESIIESP